MGRQLTVSRRGEGAPIDAMVWLLEPDVRLLDTRSFATLHEFTAWLRAAPDVSVSWTDELKADATLSMAVAEVLGAAPGDPSLPTVDGGQNEAFGDSSSEGPPAGADGGRLSSGRLQGRRHRR